MPLASVLTWFLTWDLTGTNPMLYHWAIVSAMCLLVLVPTLFLHVIYFTYMYMCDCDVSKINYVFGWLVHGPSYCIPAIIIKLGSKDRHGEKRPKRNNNNNSTENLDDHTTVSFWYKSTTIASCVTHTEHKRANSINSQIVIVWIDHVYCW